MSRAVLALAAVAIAVRPVHADEFLVRHAARAVAAGEVLALEVITPPDVTTVTSSWRDRTVPFVKVAAGRWNALIGIDVEETPGPRSVRVVARRANGAELAAVHAFTLEPKTWRTRRLKVAQRFVTPPRSVQARIAEEAALLGALFAKNGAERLWSEVVRPVDGVHVSGFGVRSVLNGQPRGPHNGADFAAVTGTPVVAPAAGVVAFARPFYYSGNTVIIDHGHGLYSTLAHLSAFDVEEGARVTAGQLVGKVGATGRVTGPHLHWSVRLLGARVDPMSLVDVLETASAGR